ncbi:MAG TPA: AIR synthase-related protein [Methanoregulaceae archaeon]|nr:AIR synthase-related protein [Methanoregulaceae archaeon]
MDVEEFARRQLSDGVPKDQIVQHLTGHLLRIKALSPEYAGAFARAVLEEVLNSRDLKGDFFSFEHSGVRMGEFGVGSRGTGDFFTHRQIARIIGKTRASVGVDEMDDAGAVLLHPDHQEGNSGEVRHEVSGISNNAGRNKEPVTGQYIVCTVDGMHSRLSDFPFLAGFHVTRATLRDVYVMGAHPLMLFSDIHVADDGDVAKIFDYTAGITVVGEALDVPLITGSTLRIGGDMVLGSRMTGCVGAVGVADHLTARKETRAGDVILMTEGAGGGTIATAAIYSGFPEVVDATINLHFLSATEAIISSSVLPAIHSMTDVTNGGLRGDVYEMAETAGCRIIIEEESVRSLVQRDVARMLENLQIDYLGVSLDALLVTAPADAVKDIIGLVTGTGVVIREIGRVEKGPSGSILVKDGKEKDFTPGFRESAYTPVKKVVDSRLSDFGEMKGRVAFAAEAAIEKKNRVAEILKNRSHPRE